jgi:hypothetical protein
MLPQTVSETGLHKAITGNIMPTYEKWNEDNTVRLNTIIDPDPTKLSKMDGYLLVVDPVIPDPATQKKGPMTFTATERSWAVVDKTQEEKDNYSAQVAAAAEAADHEALLALKKDSQYILELVGKDNTWIDNKIDLQTAGADNAEIVENIRTAIKEITYTCRDAAEIFHALYKLGRI